MEKSRFIISHAYGSGETDASYLVVLVTESEVEFLLKIREELQSLVNVHGRGDFTATISMPCLDHSWILKELPERLEEASGNSMLALLPYLEDTDEIVDFIYYSDEFDGVYRSSNERWEIGNGNIEFQASCHYGDCHPSTSNLGQIIDWLSKDFGCDPYIEGFGGKVIDFKEINFNQNGEK